MKRFLLLFGDICIFYLVLFLTLVIRYGRDWNAKLDYHLLPFSLIFIIWGLVFYISNLYEIGFAKNNIQFFTAFFYSATINAVISLTFFYLIPYFGIAPKTNLFILIILAAASQIPWRYYFNKSIAKGGYKNNTLIIGTNQQSEELYDFLLNNEQLGYHALGIIDIEDEAAAKILGNLIRQKNVKTLVLSPSVYKIPRIIEVFYGLIGFKINFFNLSDFYEITTGKIPLGVIDQAWFLENLSEGNKRGYELLKRVLDVFFSILLGLLSFFLYPFIILAIKINSPGPIFYRQVREGRAGKSFKIIKFRTMVNNAESFSGPVLAQKDDPRVTSVGKFFRKTRLDELPQLFNILRGDMSFVGPRAERPEFNKDLQEKVPFYKERYLIKPGLTGWAQIKYGYVASIQDNIERLQYDLFYIKKRSALLDLGIVLKTVNIVLTKKGR